MFQHLSGLGVCDQRVNTVLTLTHQPALAPPAPPTRDLSAQPPDRMPTVALARAMVRHRFRGLRAGYESLKGTHCGRVRPVRLVAAWPSQRGYAGTGRVTRR